MQFSKGSKKTKNADETGVPDMNTAESSGNVRGSKSSRLKKETIEMGPAKHRKTETVLESSPVLKTAAATAGGESTSRVIDSVGVMTPASQSTGVAAKSSEISPSREEIARLAHSYWVARGYAQGSPEQDWLRAERELKAKR
jgi:hypothetical protein